MEILSLNSVGARSVSKLSIQKSIPIAEESLQVCLSPTELSKHVLEVKHVLKCFPVKGGI